MAEIKSTVQHLSPVRKSVIVSRTPEEAFEIFTKRTSSWWPLSKYSLFQANSVACEIDPRVGGLIQETSKSGERATWGTVRTWDPPNRFVMSWHPGGDASTATELELRFVRVPEGTRVELEHRDWAKLGAKAEAARKDYDGGWVEVLESAFKKGCERKL
ncbi:MAG TPA: SRPBCC family protein [Candidatus Limnocylindrales bacterium]|nr:SRPBCC family protein [Candidatus Limnocylindrales bacterium]